MKSAIIFVLMSPTIGSSAEILYQNRSGVSVSIGYASGSPAVVVFDGDLADGMDCSVVYAAGTVGAEIEINGQSFDISGFGDDTEFLVVATTVDEYLTSRAVPVERTNFILALHLGVALAGLALMRLNFF